MKRIYMFIIGVCILAVIIAVVVILTHKKGSSTHDTPAIPIIPNFNPLKPNTKIIGKHTSVHSVKNESQCNYLAVVNKATAYNYYNNGTEKLCTLFTDKNLCYLPDQKGYSAFSRDGVTVTDLCTTPVLPTYNPLTIQGNSLLKLIGKNPKVTPVKNKSECLYIAITEKAIAYTYYEDSSKKLCTTFSSSDLCYIPNQQGYSAFTRESVTVTNLCTEPVIPIFVSLKIKGQTNVRLGGSSTKVVPVNSLAECRYIAVTQKNVAFSYTDNGTEKLCTLVLDEKNLCYYPDKNTTSFVQKGVTLNITNLCTVPVIPSFSPLEIGGNPAVKLYGKNTKVFPVKSESDCRYQAVIQGATAYNFYSIQNTKICTLFFDKDLCYDEAGQQFFNRAYVRTDILPLKQCSVDISSKPGKLLGDGGITVPNILDAKDCALTSETQGHKGWTWDTEFKTCTCYPENKNMCTIEDPEYVYNTIETTQKCARKSIDIDNAVFSAFSGVGTQTVGADITVDSCRTKALGDPKAVGWSFIDLNTQNKVCDVSYTSPGLCYVIDKKSNRKSGVITPSNNQPKLCPAPTCTPSHIYEGKNTCTDNMLNCDEYPMDDIRDNIFPYQCNDGKCTYAPLVDYGAKYTAKEITGGCTAPDGSDCTVGNIKGKCRAFCLEKDKPGNPQCIPDNFCLTASVPLSYNGGHPTKVNAETFPFLCTTKK